MTRGTTQATRGARLDIGCLVFPRMDQIDFTGPFEVLSRLPDATVHVVGTVAAPVRDVQGLVLTPERTLEDVPDLDVLVVPGGPGQQELMHDDRVLGLIRRHVQADRLLLSVCTGALLCGAAGVLRERRATTHWASWDLLPFYGATPVRSRVVVDGQLVSCAGVTAGLDGALTVAALLHGEAVAQGIQLEIEYAPEPQFHAGSPDTAPAEVVRAYRERFAAMRRSREEEACRHAAALGIRPEPTTNPSEPDADR